MIISWQFVWQRNHIQISYPSPSEEIYGRTYPRD